MIATLGNNQFIRIKWVGFDQIRIDIKSQSYYISRETFVEYLDIFGFSSISTNLTSQEHEIFYDLCLRFYNSYLDSFNGIRKDI